MENQNIIEVVKKIFEEFGEREAEIRNKYAVRKYDLLDKYSCENCNQREKCYYDEKIYRECMEKQNEEYDAIEVEEADRIIDLWFEYEEKLKQLGLEVEFDVHSDKNCFFTATPGYQYYIIHEYHAVMDKRRKKAYLVSVYIYEYNKPWQTVYEFDGVEIEEKELIDEDTPFTNALTDNIPWEYIREVWANNIGEFIQKIAKAERENRLNEALKEVKANVEAGLWVYDYRHFYSALMKTCKQFNISI